MSGARPEPGPVGGRAARAGQPLLLPWSSLAYDASAEVPPLIDAERA